MMMAAFLRRRVALTLFLFLLRDGQAAKRAHSKRERERREEGAPLPLEADDRKREEEKHNCCDLEEKKSSLKRLFLPLSSPPSPAAPFAVILLQVSTSFAPSLALARS